MIVTATPSCRASKSLWNNRRKGLFYQGLSKATSIIFAHPRSTTPLMWAWMSFTNFIRLQLCKFFNQATTSCQKTAAITAGSDNQFECLPVQGDVWSVSMKAWLSPTLALFTEKHCWKNSLTPKCFAHCTNEKSTEGGGSSLYVKKVTCEGML